MDKYFRIKEKISSIQNPKIKQIIHLQKSNVRKRENTIFIEGFREISAAIKSDFKIETLYVCTEIVNNNSEILKNSFIFNNIVTIEITKEVFAKIAYRDNSDGLFAVAIPKYLQLNELKLRQNPLIIVLESVEKPGNIGAILRTSEAANVDAVIVCDSKTDIYNPNVIRSGLGCVFKLQVVTCTKEELQKYLKFNNISVYWLIIQRVQQF